MYCVKHISERDIKEYWLSENHFRDPNKKISFDISRLGHFVNKIENPRKIPYGLFLGESLVGVTMIYEWNEEWVRYRTINILPEHRGKGLGCSLLKTAYLMDWENKDLFGWVARYHYDWSKKAGFQEIDGVWEDNHIGMILSADEILDIPGQTLGVE